MRTWIVLLTLLLTTLGPATASWRDHVGREETHNDIVALREAIWAVSQSARAGDVALTKHHVDTVWDLWLGLDDQLRRKVLRVYPLTERQMDHLEAEALGLAQSSQEAVPAVPVDTEHERAAGRYPGYRDPYDLFGNSGLGKL